MHARQHRLGSFAQRDDCMMKFTSKTQDHVRQLGQVGVKQRNVAASEERRTITAQHDGTHSLVVARLFTHYAQLFDHAGVERVHDLRPIERYGRDTLDHGVA